MGVRLLWADGADRAQGTVEYAIVFTIVLAMIMACASVWHAGERGIFSDQAQRAASHRSEMWGAIDVALY